jgi:hypothetical protein
MMLVHTIRREKISDEHNRTKKEKRVERKDMPGAINSRDDNIQDQRTGAQSREKGIKGIRTYRHR